MLQILVSRIQVLVYTFLLLLAGCDAGDEAPPVPSRTERAMTLLPADVRFAGMVDLQDLKHNGGIAFSGRRGVTIHFMDSDVTFNPLSAEQQARLQAFIDATGFEPGTDLHALYAATDSVGAPTALLVAEFNRERLLDELQTEFGDRLTTTAYRDTPIVTIERPDREVDVQFALLDGGWIVLSPERATLQAVIDRWLDGTGVPPAGAVQPLVQEVAGRGGVWGVARNLPDQPVLARAENDRVSQIARAVRDVAAALNFEGDGVAGIVLLTTDQNAGDLADVVRGVIAAAKANEDLSDEQRRMLDRIRVNERNGQVWIDFRVDEATLARLLIQTIQSREAVTASH